MAERGGWKSRRERGFPSHEATILRSLSNLANIRERYEEEREPGDPDFEDTPELLNGIANFLKLQGMFIAHLALDPETSEELIPDAVQAPERIPAWMELRVFGPTEQPLRYFALGCAQILGEQREAIERIAEEQIENPEALEEIEATLAACPIPEDREDEPPEALFARASVALRANFHATLIVARDVDEWLAEELERRARGEEEGEYEDDDEFEEFEDEYEDDEFEDDEYDEDE